MELTTFEQEFGLTVNEEGNVITNSIKVSEYYKKDHADVLKKIRKFIELIPELADGNFTLGSYLDINSQSRPMFTMDRQGFSMLVNKFTGDEATIFTYKYTKAFEEMAEELEYRREQNIGALKSLTEKEEKQQRKLMLESYFGKRKTVKTFKYCTYEEFNNLVLLFEEYTGQIRDAENKRIEYDRFIDGLTQNRNKINPVDKMYMPKTTTYSYFIHEYVRRKSSSENKSYGQTIRYKDELIKEQVKAIKELNPSIEEYTCFNIHPISENYMYKPVSHFQTKEPIMARTEAYNIWIKNFPRKEAIPKEDLCINWSEPIKIFIKVDCLEKFDTTNFIKAINDMIVNRIYDEDDKIVMDTKITRNKVVNSYKEGKIYVCIKNI
ncbi:Rha family transcriptional regulator [Clostridium estertheticum]|uniref:Rha family transcriptional regulator n=1 Tax=Clostridium estertheticum TaxID=238834 RepID=UPI001C0D4BA7|nr:Rha family transcriptional regulator [Clostridium estertheticum]MBU3186673.1 Rha family transcriptional regulator [Clostridium estertheticum]